MGCRGEAWNGGTEGWETLTFALSRMQHTCLSCVRVFLLPEMLLHGTQCSWTTGLNLPANVPFLGCFDFLATCLKDIQSYFLRICFLPLLWITGGQGQAPPYCWAQSRFPDWVKLKERKYKGVIEFAQSHIAKSLWNCPELSIESWNLRVGRSSSCPSTFKIYALSFCIGEICWANTSPAASCHRQPISGYCQNSEVF